MKSLWWFYSNLPLCKTLPQDFDLIREKCPGIIREKVIDLVCMVINKDTVCNTNPNGNNRVGSGRIMRQTFGSFGSNNSKSFDDGDGWKHDTNNNKSFRRATSSVCLDHLPLLPKMVPAAREA